MADSRKVSAISRPLSQKERRIIWQIVYFVSIIGWDTWMQCQNPKTDVLIGLLIWTPFFIVLLPFGLGVIMGRPFQWLGEHYSQNHGADIFTGVGIILMLPLAFAIFYIHWRYTNRVTNARLFLLLMATLIAITCLGMSGCMECLEGTMPSQ